MTAGRLIIFGLAIQNTEERYDSFIFGLAIQNKEERCDLVRIFGYAIQNK